MKKKKTNGRRVVATALLARDAVSMHLISRNDMAAARCCAAREARGDLVVWRGSVAGAVVVASI